MAEIVAYAEAGVVDEDVELAVRHSTARNMAVTSCLGDVAGDGGGGETILAQRLDVAMAASPLRSVT